MQQNSSYMQLSISIIIDSQVWGVGRNPYETVLPTDAVKLDADYIWYLTHNHSCVIPKPRLVTDNPSMLWDIVLF